MAFMCDNIKKWSLVAVFVAINAAIFFIYQWIEMEYVENFDIELEG